MHKIIGLKHIPHIVSTSPTASTGFVSRFLNECHRVFSAWRLARDLEKGWQEHLAGKTKRFRSIEELWRS